MTPTNQPDNGARERLHGQRRNRLRKPDTAGFRRGRLLNGNPSGDFLKAPRCGAKTRRGAACQCPSIRGRRRCRLHGGLSTGPRTLEGRKRSRASVLKHGRYSVIEREVRTRFQDMSAEMRERAASTRDRFFRELYTRVANQKPTPDALARIRDTVIRARMR